MRTIKDKYIKPAFTELPRKKEVFIDPVSGESTKTNNYYSARHKFIKEVECYTDMSFHPDYKLYRQKSEYKPFTSKSSKLDRCPNQRVVRKEVHGKLTQLVVPCGKCSFCLHKKQNELILRCINEVQSSDLSIFVTLTFNEGTINEKRELHYKDVQNFFKRLRFCPLFNRSDIEVSFRYLVSGEYGDIRHRPHYHVNMFIKGYTFSDIELIRYYINLCWGNGFITIAPCNANTIAYTTKYMCKQDYENNPDNWLPPTPTLIKWSKGLGADYVLNNPNILKQYRDKNRIYYTNKDKSGKNKEYSVSLPLYYRYKIFTPYEQYLITEDYLNSLQYKNQLSLMKDITLFSHLIRLGDNYEKKALHKRELNRKIKNARKSTIK